PGGSARGPLARFCSAFWEQAAAAGDTSPLTGPPGGGTA
ncbi:septum formation initiator, partial [Streptomyces sp. SID10115]|nr:septum formation initiator [Streptomyces sp. SID10115]